MIKAHQSQSLGFVLLLNFRNSISHNKNEYIYLIKLSSNPENNGYYCEILLRIIVFIQKIVYYNCKIVMF